jgi:hypothetical protein
METYQEKQERMLLEIGEAMNDNFTKQDLKEFYDFLKRVKKIVDWYEFKGNYFRFEDVLYIANKKFAFSIMNIDPKAMIKDQYKSSDRRPTEILVELPVQTSMNGLNSKKVILKSKDNNFGGMLYNDFLDFIDTVKWWIKEYDPRKYEDYNSGTFRAYGDEAYEDVTLEDLAYSKKQSKLSSNSGLSNFALGGGKRKKRNNDDYLENFSFEDDWG